MTVADLHGHPALLWFVVTWGCVSCDVSTSAIADHVSTFSAHGVRIVELELADDLGQPGPGIADYKSGFGNAANSLDWIWGTASRQLTNKFDASGTVDQYFLLDGNGHTVLSGSVPASSMDQLLQRVNNI